MSKRLRAGLVGLSVGIALTVLIGGLLGQASSEGAYKQLAVFSEVLTRIRSDYVEEPPLPRVIAGALHGLVVSLDPYSSYLTPPEFAEYKAKHEQQTGDVGLVLSKDSRRSGLITVVSTLPGSPAARAELRTGDYLESIAGFSSREMSIEQAHILLAGEPGTGARITVVRQRRSEPIEIELVRTRVERPALVSGLVEPEVGYLKVAAFSSGTAREIRSALDRLETLGARRLILDLRQCASGSVEEGVATAQLFLERGVIARVEGQKYPRQEFAASPGQTAWRGPMSVLIDAGTAGPAELLAAAVGDNGRGSVAGERSYGVGSLQKLIPLEDGAALLLSVAKYYSPSGRAIQDEAVVPNLTVASSDEDSESAGLLPHAMPARDDPVVGKALEWLRGQASRPSA